MDEFAEEFVLVQFTDGRDALLEFGYERRLRFGRCQNLITFDQKLIK